VEAISKRDDTLAGATPRTPWPERLVRQAGGECRATGAFRAENALRGRWKMRCRDSDLGVSITLAPTEPARVQLLEVTPLARNEEPGTAAVCR